ncbi:hypothetical protein CEXT_96551 [Caerostris extrusa]|uniref:Uncharacterized protein n=1 Tax=Caerostris extrusa TaxID=172846 RepID=A0AAV4SRB0_CAEEX|nr:hypothetical protein CEXT_96551 [Caerostris extrusa]
MITESPLPELLTTSFTPIEPVKPPLWTSQSCCHHPPLSGGVRPKIRILVRVTWATKPCDKWMSVIWDLSPEQNVAILSKAECSRRLRSDDCDQSPALDGSERICRTDG